MADAAHTTLVVVLVLTACVWVGGYVAVAVVARVATRTLEPAARVAFFRTFGRVYNWVGTPALIVALGVGVALLAERGWDGTATAATVIGALVLLALGVGVIQARRMTVLRAQALRSGAEEDASRVRAGARSAGLLRAGIGVLTLALVVIGSVLGA